MKKIIISVLVVIWSVATLVVGAGAAYCYGQIKYDEGYNTGYNAGLYDGRGVLERTGDNVKNTVNKLMNRIEVK